jgi:glycosyltransferase involved in cell wall biosynthesis
VTASGQDADQHLGNEGDAEQSSPARDPQKDILILRRSVNELRESLAADNRTISELREETARRRQAEDEIRNALDASNRTVSELRDDAARQRHVEDQLHAALTSSTKTIFDLRVLVVRLDAESAALRLELQELIRSTSWKISSPIRMIGRRLPRLARVGRNILRPFWRMAHLAFGRREPVVTRSCGSSRFSIESAIFPSPQAAPRVPSKLACLQSNSLVRFGTLQDSVGSSFILVAADMPPMFDKHSGALRLYNIMRIFAETGRRLLFASEMTRERFDAFAAPTHDRVSYEKRLSAIGVEKIAYGVEEIETLLGSIGNDVQWAFLSFPMVAHRLISRVRAHAPWASIIYDMVDFHWLRMAREAELKSDMSLLSAADHMRAIELTNARAADTTIAISEEERRALLELDPNLLVQVVPNVFDMPSVIRSNLTDRSGLLFVGGFSHAPNADAVFWFVTKVWPLIHRQRPDLKFCIAGSNTPDEIFALENQPGVDVVGYVPDLTDLFCRSRVFVAPLRYGAGLKGKIGQSMAYGLPVVTTRVGAEGMGVQDGKHLLIADTVETFIAAVLRLVDDDELWSRLEANGRKLIESTQSFQVVRTKVEELLNG